MKEFFKNIYTDFDENLLEIIPLFPVSNIYVWTENMGSAEYTKCTVLYYILFEIRVSLHSPIWTKLYILFQTRSEFNLKKFLKYLVIFRPMLHKSRKFQGKLKVFVNSCSCEDYNAITLFKFVVIWNNCSYNLC